MEPLLQSLLARLRDGEIALLDQSLATGEGEEKIRLLAADPHADVFVVIILLAPLREQIYNAERAFPHLNPQCDTKEKYMRSRKITNENYDDDGLGVHGWKGPAELVLDTIDDQLEPFGLQIVVTP